MATKIIDIPEIGPVTLYKRRGNRSLRLSLSADGEVRVSMPTWVPYKAGEQFARAKIAWIVAHRQPPADTLKQGQAIGKAHRLHFAPSLTGSKVTTRLRQNLVEITFPARLSPDHPDVQRAARTAAIGACAARPWRSCPNA
jgi:predicted metal-dependent hydrolase